MRMIRFLFKALTVVTALSLSTSDGHSQLKENPFITEATRVLELLRAGNAAAIHSFSTEKIKAGLPEAQLSGLWKSIEGQFGSFKGVSDSSVSTKDSLQIVALVCDFEKGSLQATLAFEPGGKLAGLFFGLAPPKGAYVPAEYVRTESFTEEDVSFGIVAWKVAGTLSLPKAQSPYPAVILVHGSGPHDRDESLGPNRPFKDIAWGLASRGIAVLRYEKRTKAHAHQFTSASMTVKEEVVDDALEAIDFLRSRGEVDSRKIFLLGHSLGAMLAPEIATLSGKLAGIILAAGPARHLEDVIVDQIEYITSLKEGRTDADKNMVSELKENLAKLKAHTLPDSARIIGIPARYLYDLGKRDQVAFAQHLQIPILILQGERDYQVTMEDISLWKKAIGSRTNVKIITYPDLNHLFSTGSGKAKPEEYFRPGYVAKQMIEDVSSWIKENSLAK